MPADLPIQAVVDLARPWGLAALVGALVPVAMALRGRCPISRHPGRADGRPPRKSSGVLAGLQCGAIALLALAAAGPRVYWPAGGNVLLLRDVSGSVRGQGGDIPLLPPGFAGETLPFCDGLSTDTVGPTRIAPALRVAAGRAGQDAAVVILTDGRFEDPHWRQAASRLGEAGTPVLVLPLDAPPPDARVARLDTARLPAGEVRVTLAVAAGAPLVRRVLLTRRGRDAPLLDREISLAPGRPLTLRAEDDPRPDRAAVYELSLTPTDAFTENDTATAALLPVRRGVAVVTGPGSSLPDRLRAGLGWTVRPLDPEDAPRTPEGWLDYTAVVVVDPTGRLLDRDRRDALAACVRGGTGLVWIGAGPHGSPTDRTEPINRVLPLTPNPAERQPLAVTVVLDASGSMGRPGRATRRRFDAAADAVLALRRHLTARDRLAVLTFAAEPRVLFEGGVGDLPGLQRALEAVRPAGPTNAIPALELATAGPPPPETRGLVVLVSDLRTEDYTPGELARLVERFESGGWSLGVVAPSTADARDAHPARPQPPVAIALAERLGGAVVRRPDLDGLGAVFADFLRRARGTPIRRGRFVAAGMGSAFGLEVADPRLAAYVLSAISPQAERLASVGTDPVLARGQAGLGRAVALAAGLTPGENAELEGWAGWPALPVAAVRWAARPASDPRFGGTLARVAGRLVVEVRAEDAQGPMSGLNLVARATPLAGEGELRETPLRPLAPGLYRAELPSLPARGTRTGDGVWAVTVRSDGRVHWRAGVGTGPAPEFARIGADHGVLAELAARTGGRVVSPDELPDVLVRTAGPARRELWPVCLLAAVGLMLVEWSAARRA